jgi:hypothetical protein
MAIRGRRLIPRYNLPLCYRDTQTVAGSDSPFDNDPDTTETIFTKKVAEMCIIQEPTKEDLQLLDSGISSEKVKRIYTNTFVPSIPEGSDRLPALFYISNAYFTIDASYPAEIGGWFKVVVSQPYLNNVINHYEILAVRIDEEDEDVPDTTDFDTLVTTRGQFMDSTLWEDTWLTT